MAVESKRRRRERMNSQDDDCVLLKSERLSDSENDPATTDNQCSICFETMNDLAYTDGCFHVFCFNCLFQWAKQHPDCPHCRKPFRTITHNIRAPDDYEEYQVPGVAHTSGVFPLGSHLLLPTVQVRLQTMADRIASMTHGNRRREPFNYHVGFPGNFQQAPITVGNGYQQLPNGNFQPNGGFNNEAVMFMNGALGMPSHSITIGEFFARRAHVSTDGTAIWSGGANPALSGFNRTDSGNPAQSVLSPSALVPNMIPNQAGPSTSGSTLRPSKPNLFERLMSNLAAPTWLSEVLFSPESIEYRRRVYSKRTRIDYHSRLPRAHDDAHNEAVDALNGHAVDVKPTLDAARNNGNTTSGIVNGKYRGKAVVEEADRHRVEEWLFRELSVLLASTESEYEHTRTRANAAKMTRYVFELLRDGADLTSSAFASRLRPFLADQTDRFVRELDFAVRCRLDLRNFDRHARRVGRYRFSSFPAYWRYLDKEAYKGESRKRKLESASSSLSDSSPSNGSESSSADQSSDDDVEVLPGSSSPRRPVAPPSFFSNRFSNTEMNAIVIDEDENDTPEAQPSPQSQQNGAENFNSTLRDANRLIRLLNERWSLPATAPADQPSSSSSSEHHLPTTNGVSQTESNGISAPPVSNAAINLPSTSSSAVQSTGFAVFTDNSNPANGAGLSQFDSDLLDDALSVIGEHEANRSALTISDSEDDEVEVVHTEGPRPIELSSSSSSDYSDLDSDSDSHSDSGSVSDSNSELDTPNSTGENTLESVANRVRDAMHQEEPPSERIES